MDFPQNWKEIRKTFVLAKSWVESLATFSLKKFFKKTPASWFFLKKVLKKRKFFRVFHLSSLISQNRDQIQKPFFLKTNSKDVGFFVLIKFSSSSMTPSFFCYKYLIFLKKFLISFLLELVYLYPVYQDRERIRSPWFRNLYEGSVGYV